ncbi:MAG: hypothetical protein AUG51_01120 [Acidobacteria bacterium 13_1_20CM_3_53_8]|nr:MAG: hypothetical protein AUG51_01120 [Acidobacteria bacterium 13_1_20CM_3_53_8]
MPQANPTPTPEAIATYASDCTTPKTSFVLNEVVCAKATGIDLQTFPRSVTWNNTGGLVVSRTDLTGNTISFQIPNDATYAIDNQTGDNRGIWQVKLVPVGRSVVRANAFFTVSDPTSKAADLVVYNVVNDPIGDVPDGANITVSLTTTNNGPDAVPDVQLTELVPSNATFVSASQDSGPTFNCAPPAAGASVCTISSFASGAQATFTFIYNVNSGVPKGTVIASTAAIGQITSPTSVVSELNSRDNQWTARAATSVNTNTPTGCVLACPENMIVTATSQSGAVVNYGSAEPSGTCGTISGDASHPSGSTFPVGTTTVNLTSSQGGGGCSFTVTVVEVAAPTITCQADQTAQATGSQLEVPVSLNTPSTSGNGVILDHSSRSDNRPLTDPYPVGTTIITWVATETFQGTDPQTNDPIVIEGRAVSCTQKIIVTSTGAPTISCPTDRTFNAASCDTVLTAAQIGTPTYSGSNATLTSRRSDDLALTDPFPGGQTRITWTVTDDVDRVASCVQTITITSTGGGDTTPPTLDVPPDVTVTTGGCSALLDDELGVATADDNCSSSVSITRTGIPLNQLGQPTFVFPVGVTTITYTATDGAGNSTVKTQKITVKELTPPTISAPADVVLYTGAGATSCGLNIANLDASLGTATTSDNCPGTVTVARSNVPAGNNFPVGDTIVTYTATDISGNTASANQKVTVRDNTVPTISAPADVTLYTGSGATTCDVTVSNLDATLGTATANDNCPGVTVARGGGNVFPLGDTNVIYTATDAYGNTATATQKVTVVDNTPPVVTPPANITVHLPLNSTATSMVVNYPNPATATDNCAGTITFNYNPASGSTFSVGTTTVTVTATDAHNNNAQTTFTVTVLYNFTGFFSPVINPPTFNVVNAGRAIPVKFSLSGNKGLNIFAANSPQSGVIPCDASAPATNLTDTVTAGSSSLSYDASTDQYIYVWKTDSSWAGTCRQLVVTLNDGSVHVANFKFR